MAAGGVFSATDAGAPPWHRGRPLWPMTDSPLNLALFRVITCLLLLTCRDLYSAPAVAALPEGLRTPPERLGWLLGLLPIRPALAAAAVSACVVAAALGAIGLWSRTALIVATLSAFYALGVSQLGSAVWHCHHLVWFCLLLCVSPCGDALSIDAWRASRRAPSLRVVAEGPWEGTAYGLPLRAAWVLIGCIFFFPGLWKLRSSGLGWIDSDNLRNQMYWKWLQAGGVLPALRIDRLPGLCRLLAGAVVGFELLFPLLVLRRATRLWAVAAALLFHGGTQVLMGIDFSGLWPSYLIFFDWTGGLGERSRRADRRVLGPPRRVGPALAVSGVLIVAAIAYGAQGRMNAWPVACYPTFQWTAGPTMPALLVEVEGRDGRRAELPRPWQLGTAAGPRAWALAWSLLGIGLDRQAVQPQRLRAYWEYLRTLPAVRAQLREAVVVRFYGAALAVAPDQWAAPPRTRRLLYELALPPNP